MLRKHAYTSDISNAYLRVLVDISSIKLRIFVWFEDPLTMQKPIFFLRNTMDFGDGVSSAILTIVQRKIVAPLCKLQLSKQIVIAKAYADNYCSRFRKKETYMAVKKDMEQAHDVV